MEERAQKLGQIMTAAYDHHMEAIFRFCSIKTRNKETAIDITQQTFLKTWEYMRSGHELANIRAFLYRTAGNLIIDWYRKKKEESLDALQESGFEPEGEMKTEQEAELRLVRQVLARLDADESMLLIWRFYEGFTPKEIAPMIDETPNTTSVRILRALKKVEKILHAQKHHELSRHEQLHQGT